jgi:hypothetical protein
VASTTQETASTTVEWVKSKSRDFRKAVRSLVTETGHPSFGQAGSDHPNPERPRANRDSVKQNPEVLASSIILDRNSQV